MVLAPLGGALLAVIVAGALWLAVDQHLALDSLLLAILAVSALAVLTRAMHLDGLADTADGLGSGRRGDAALAVMKQSDIGPFGVVTLVLVLLLQVAALHHLLAFGWGPAVLALALVVSRGVLPLLCTAWFPAARPDGLGAMVARSVGGVGVLVSLALTVGVATVLVLLLGYDRVGDPDPWLHLGAADGMRLAADEAWPLAVAGVAGLLAGVLLALRARTRFGGVTGDVHGAAVEATFTATLLLAAALLP